MFYEHDGKNGCRRERERERGHIYLRYKGIIGECNEKNQVENSNTHIPEKRFDMIWSGRRK